MVYIGAVGISKPPNTITQSEAKQFIQQMFDRHAKKKIERLLPVFDNAKIEERQIVVEKEWFEKTRSFHEANEVYVQNAIELSLRAIDNCLHDERLKNEIPYEAIDMIIFVSSSGIATPSIDAHLLNYRSFREDIKRMPLWGLGCAGGAIGISRGFEWVKLHPKKTALVISAELCSLTFQKNDLSTSNIVGTALFGDGVAATLLIGSQSKYKNYINSPALKIISTSSFTKKDTLHIMGWNVVETGLEVIFSRRIPKLVKSVWKDHVHSFLSNHSLTMKDVSLLIAHPGGRKVLEEMENSLQIDRHFLRFSYDVLAKHGNMSSATVMYVLEKTLLFAKMNAYHEKKAILSALGPGFSSELILMEWMDG